MYLCIYFLEKVYICIYVDRCLYSVSCFGDAFNILLGILAV